QLDRSPYFSGSLIYMRQFRLTTILLACFFSLAVESRSSIFAQQPSPASEKERGIELYRKGDFIAAVEALEEAVKKQGSDSDAWYYLGLSLRDSGKVKDARKVFEKTLSMRPNFAQGYTLTAVLMAVLMELTGARRL
ncbi:MAG: tetratricopeptide repeat protein, partial [Blastocatellia bacterium]|nr:tetratricopeptide repeat protein [Blastocatellia bacterium]